jgi:ribosomal protein L15
MPASASAAATPAVTVPFPAAEARASTRNTVRRDFEGGQTPLLRRLPRSAGSRTRSASKYQPVNLVDLARFEAGAEVTPERCGTRAS